MAVVFTLVGALALMATLAFGIQYLIKNVSLKGKDNE